jgi:hypothetical protein
MTNHSRLVSARVFLAFATVALMVAAPMATPAGAATAPGAPTIGTAVGGVAAISVTFAAPASNGGSPITGYTATCVSSNGGATRSVSGSSSPIVVSPLTNGRTYTCTVTASNAVGKSAPSGTSNAAAVATVPGAPTLVGASSRNVSLLVAFSPPGSDGGSAITHYTASCVSSNGGLSGSATGAAGPIIVNGLTNAKTYTCAVTATNAVGTGGSSAASNAAAPAVTVPDPPVGVPATSRNASVSVAFTAPANNGGSSITSFGVSCVSANGGASGSASGGASPIIVNGLTNGKTYTCVVTATSALGTSVPSAASSPTVPMTVPGAPTIGTTTSRNVSLSVGFTGPANNGGSAITGYTATCVSSNGGAAGSASGTASPIIVNGLTNVKTYTCTVTATNVVGPGAPSAASNAAVPAVTVPDPPAGVLATSRNHSLSVTFGAPANNGGSAITGYGVSCVSSNGGASGAASGTTSPMIIDGLTNGFLYACTATARSALGTSVPSAASNSIVPAVTVPDPPTGITATSRNLSLSVGFSAPGNNGGSAITGYTASCTSSNGGVAGSASGAASPIIVNGLTNGKTYACVVTATSALGTSVPSAASNTAAPAATVPDPPTIGTATGRYQAAIVAFTAPANNGGSTITSYSATCVSSNGGPSGSASGTASPILVSGLWTGRTYSCTVRATSGLGTGAPSAASNTFVPAVTVPDPPTGVTAARRYLSLSVAFAAPAYDGGSGITSYTASCTSSNGGVAGSATGAASPIIVNGLTNAKTYTCIVTAANVLGSSAASPASNAVVPGVTAPDSPTLVTATSRNVSLSVAFTAPANNGGSSVTAFGVSCVSSNGGATGSTTGAASPIIVNGLTNGKTYTCAATATNALGTSVPSAASNATVPGVTAPDPPTMGTATGANKTVSVTFGAPANNGGSAITSYTASCVSSNGGASGSASGGASPIVVASLTNAATYTCTVRATSALGTSAPSATSNATFVATAPGAPAIASAKSRNVSLAVAFFGPADDGGSAITSFTASCVSSNGGANGSASGGVSPIIVNGLTNGKTYTCSVTASNALGASPASGSSNTAVPAVTVPDPPVITGTIGKDGRLTVSFAPPANDGGSAITAYSTNCASSNGGTPGSTAGATSPALVSPLTNGGIYTCAVTATSTLGTSIPSAASIATLVATVPDAPTVALVLVNNASLRVVFNGPADNGGSAVSSYAAYCVSSNGGVARRRAASTSPIDVSNLTNGKVYTCSVTASNGVGSSGASSKSRSLVVGAPKAPTSVVATSRPTTSRIGSITVKYTARSNNGAAITKFSAYCLSNNGGVARGKVLLGSTASSITVAKVTTGRAYSCFVTATNSRGVSIASTASPLVVVGAPAAPTAVHAVRTAAGQLQVTFKAGANNGGAILGYAVSCVSDDGGLDVTITTATTTATVSGLTAGKTYECTVVAANARGTSAASAPSAPVGA